MLRSVVEIPIETFFCSRTLVVKRRSWGDIEIKLVNELDLNGALLEVIGEVLTDLKRYLFTDDVVRRCVYRCGNKC
jgi:hypothetical protein